MALPPDEDEEQSTPTYILASRLQPSGHDNEKDSLGRKGVQQILVLAGPSKACVLCNGTVSFYILPELSPAFPNREPTGVQWIGGLDENDGRDAIEPVVMIANAKRILIVKVGEKLRPAKSNIEYPGCLRSSRRDTIACVADGSSYALLEVEHQQKIPLFPISTSTPSEQLSHVPPSITAPPRQQQNTSPGHGRSTSLGNMLSTVADRTRSPQPHSPRSDSLQPRPRNASSERAGSRQRSSTDSTITKPEAESATKPTTTALQPHILSPFPTEFMLTTGTSQTEPGVGMFVNVDGDVVRGTVEFSSYPEALITDAPSQVGDDLPLMDDAKQIIVALLQKTGGRGPELGLEIQQLPEAAPAQQAPAIWLPVPSTTGIADSRGLSKVMDAQEHRFSGIVELMQAVPLRTSGQGTLSQYKSDEEDPRTSSAVEQVEQEKSLFDNGSNSPPGMSTDAIRKRLAEEKTFVSRFGKASTRRLLWHGERLWQILQNPLLMQLEAKLMSATGNFDLAQIEPKKLLQILAEVRGREATNELDFLTLSYVRQKASLLLFLHLQSLLQLSSELAENQSAIENALHEAGLDPRIVLLLIPPLAAEVNQGTQGIWLHQGVIEVVGGFKSSIATFQNAPIEFWMMIRHYLTLWQEKRGYGSITDEKLVFDSVDAALLHTLLYLDQTLPSGSGVQVSARSKLNNVVDHWKGDFDRAASLLERYQRLYVLSRLYQSKKQAKAVLGTWRRILDGEQDVDYGSDSADLELQIKRYLNNIRDSLLVQDYGIWLAQRNPSLGVQVFAEDASKVKFDPHEVIILLKQQAPDAVQQYLEYLVFNKTLDRYSDDLIGYYLDSVLSVLESSENARSSLAQTYSTYRALNSPKPTYLNFIRENAPPDTWWQSRLRLLQLLGSGGYGTSATSKELTYSIPKVLERLAPFSKYLVSESIILDARQGRHKEALQLLTHGLGDYDTAVRYCYFGGPAAQSSTIDVSALPPRPMQEELFECVFHEFLSIEDKEECIERTSQLLGKFATWFDPLKILISVPDHWEVGTLSEFLLRSFRAATTQRNEAVIMKALSAAQNLQIQANFVEVCEKVGATIEAEKSAPAGPDERDGPGHAVYDDGVIVS